MPTVSRKSSKKSKVAARRVGRARPIRSATVRKKRIPISKPEQVYVAAPATTKVRVRMYRQGLGDCFLLTFGLGGDEKHILIDCGTLGATTTGIKLADVVADID